MGQSTEAAEAAMDREEEAQQHMERMHSVAEKVANKYDRLHPSWRNKPNERVMMKFTIGELRALRRFLRNTLND